MVILRLEQEATTAFISAKEVESNPTNNAHDSFDDDFYDDIDIPEVPTFS